MEQVILVNEHDQELGTLEKLEAHQKGVLHRAFSALVFNSKGELLIQQRAHSKYHSAGLWTNTCCSHPKPGESIEEAARRRLQEEMGIEVQPQSVYSFIYKANLDGGLIEHEFDHVLLGHFDGEPKINKHEVADWKFASLQELRIQVQDNPAAFTHWFKLILNHPEINSFVSVQS
jgi:isopentenyl-diphosphate Delta-isomerase